MADEMLIDTRDMVGLHQAFSRALGDAPAQIAAVTDGDAVGAQRLASYFAELLWLLHAHHDGEDALLYPLLNERAPEHSELYSRMDSQHKDVTTAVEEANASVERFGETGSAVDGRAASAALTGLLEALRGHLSEEEQEILPIAARLMSPPEWGAMPAHALSQYEGDRIWLPFGIAFEAMPEDIQEQLLTHLPPVRDMWLGGGADAYREEMAAIRVPG